MKYIFYGTLYLIIGGIIYFNSCSPSTEVTPPNTSDCGSHHNFSRDIPQSVSHSIQGGFTTYEAQFLGPFEILDNICTKTEPSASSNGTWTNSGSNHDFTVKMKVYVSVVSQYTGNATITQTSTAGSWTVGSFSCGLVQAYGQGPGQILAIGVAVSFPSRPTPAEDSVYFGSSGFIAEVSLSYDEYRAPTDGGSSWLPRMSPRGQSVFPGENTPHFFDTKKRENAVVKIVNSTYLIGDKKRYFDLPFLKLD